MTQEQMLKQIEFYTKLLEQTLKEKMTYTEAAKKEERLNNIEIITELQELKTNNMNQTGTTTISWKPSIEVREKPMSAVMQLLNFILVERRQEDGSIKFHAHEDFSRFLQIEKDNLKDAHLDGQSLIDYKNEYAEAYYNETFNETYNK